MKEVACNGQNRKKKTDRVKIKDRTKQERKGGSEGQGKESMSTSHKKTKVHGYGQYKERKRD